MPDSGVLPAILPAPPPNLARQRSGRRFSTLLRRILLVNLLIVGLTMHAGSLALAPTPTDPIAVLAKDAANVAVAALPQVPK